MQEAIERAIEELKLKLPENRIGSQEDGSGGAWVIIEELPIGAIYVPELSWVGFRITFQYPYADVYPHFVRSDLVRKENRALGDGFSGGHNFQGRSAIQVSRRSNRLNPMTDTAYLKLMKVIEWMKTRA